MTEGVLIAIITSGCALAGVLVNSIFIRRNAKTAADNNEIVMAVRKELSQELAKSHQIALAVRQELTNNHPRNIRDDLDEQFQTVLTHIAVLESKLENLEKTEHRLLDLHLKG